MDEPLPLHIRPIRPDDAPELREGLRRLSRETRYRRFHAVVSDLSTEQWTYLTNVDGRDHVALVACSDVELPDGPRGAIVGVARFVRELDDRTAAEVAFVVYDGVQRRGVGRALCRALVDAAWARGIRTFRAHVLPGNGAMRALFERAGLDVVRERDGVVEARLERLARSA